MCSFNERPRAHSFNSAGKEKLTHGDLLYIMNSPLTVNYLQKIKIGTQPMLAVSKKYVSLRNKSVNGHVMIRRDFDF